MGVGSWNSLFKSAGLGGGIAGGMEYLMTGKDLGRTVNEIQKDAIRQGAIGSKLTDEGLQGLRDLDGTFSEQLANGGLTPELQRQFSVASGRLTDQYVRSGRSLKAALEQRRMQSQGQLTPGAIAELEKENEIASGEQYFDSSNQLAGEKAMLTYDSTKDLFDRITNIRDTIRTTGLTKEQMSMMSRLQAASLSLNRNKAINDAATGWFSMLGGGMGGK